MGVLNFLIFVVIAIVIGGDAVNGRIVNGHFYVANHGRLTEVSEAVHLQPVARPQHLRHAPAGHSDGLSGATGEEGTESGDPRLIPTG